MIKPIQAPGDTTSARPHMMRVERLSVHLRHLYISRRDNAIEEAACLYCIHGRGIIGDRCFGDAEGYKGQITFFAQEVFKRLCRAVGLVVQRLQRVAFGSLELGELPSGEWRELTPVEVERLAAAGRSHPPGPAR